MAGLAARFAATATADPPTPVTAIADALTHRGPDAATWHGRGAHLTIRAALPAVREHAGRALIIDGIADPGALVGAYARSGPTGLVTGGEPYALVLVDPGRDALVLARSGDGPPLHWARHDRAVLVASEPAALIAAGVPAEPDREVVRRFLATGACDDTEQTFLAGVRQLLPGQIVDITRDVAGGPLRVRVVDGADPPPAPPEQVLTQACTGGRLGVRLAGGYAGAAALGVALRHAGPDRPLPVYSVSLPELSVAGSTAATVLGPLSSSVVRHRAVPFFLDEIDIDAYLRDLGEPTPQVDDWLLWSLARRVAGDVDVLVEPARVGAHLSRLADRAAARFGIAVRTPMRQLAADGEPSRERLTELAARALPAGSVVPPTPSGGLAPAILAHLRAELVATFLGRPAALADALTLVAGGRVDADRLWREYVLARWLRQLKPPATTSPAAGAPVPGWRVLPVRTEALGPEDKLAERIAWRLAEAVTAAATTGAMAGPTGGTAEWYAVVAARPLAVMQDRARPLWHIRPGWSARVLGRVARRTHLGSPWAMQVAIDESGPARMWLAAIAAATGVRRWYAAAAGPSARAVRGPREDAVWPGSVAVTPAPADPARVAAEVLGALRGRLPETMYAACQGCVIASDEVLAFAARPGSGAALPDLAAWRRAAPGPYAPFALLIRRTADGGGGRGGLH